MAEIVIYKRNGTVRYRLDSFSKLCTVKSAEQKRELLGEDTVTIKTSSAEPLELVVGDYIEIYGSKYTLNKVNEPTKISERKFENSMVFEGLQYKLIDAQYRNADAAGHNPSAEFPIVANMRLLMQLLISNINRVAISLNELWELGECPETEHKEYSFSNENCLEVLQRVCKDNKLEFEIEAITTKRFRLHIRKVGQLFPASFTFGRGGGVYKLTRKNVNSNNIVTRLYLEGSTRNITSKYRNGALRLRIGDNEESYIENPTAVAAFGIKEGSRTYEDIYPHRTGKVTSLVAGDGLKFVDNTMFDLNEKDESGQTRWLMEGTCAKVKFVGNCNLSGYQFEVAKFDSATKTFTLNLYEDSRGLKIPDGRAYTIEKNAEYVLLDIVMPNDPYVVDAEAELKAAGEKDLAQDSQPKVEYELELSSLELKRKFGSEAGIVNLFNVGDYLPIKDTDINVDKAIRIKGFTRDCYADPYKYKVTLSDTVEVSIIQQLLEDNAELGRIVVLNDLTNVARARANWRTTQELLGMVFDSDGYFDPTNIRPSSIETLMLSVGNRAGQFVLRNIFIEANAAVSGKPNPNYIRITSASGQLIHYAIEETDRTWAMNGLQVTLNTSAALYIYAVCPKAGTTGSFAISTTKYATEVGTNYYFPVGVLSSVYNGYREVTTTYGATRITGRCINCGRIESIDKGTYFDLDNGEIGGNIKFKAADGSMQDVGTAIMGHEGLISDLQDSAANNATAIDGLTSGVASNKNDINDLKDTVKVLNADISEHGTSISEMEAYINGQSEVIQELQELTSSLQEQVDNTIEYWYGDIDPATDEEPAVNWQTEEDKRSHLGDIYTNIETGAEFRYSRLGYSSIVNGTLKRGWRYYWQQVASTGLGAAIVAANNAMNTANGKNHVYITANAQATPPPTYHIGDLWVMVDTFKIRVCINNSDGIAYKSADWENAGYTDDTKANEALGQLEAMADDGIITPMEKLQLNTQMGYLQADYAVVCAQAQLGGVSYSALITSFQNLLNYVQPILANMEVESNVDRAEYNNYFSNYYSKRAAVLTAISNSKCKVYTTASFAVAPATKYNKGDLWIALDTFKVRICITSSSNGYYAAHWKNAGYTDDTKANEALGQLEALADDSIITPAEKLQLQTEMSNINADFASTSAKATSAGVDTSAFEAAYNALKTYVTAILADMEVDSNVDRAEYNSKFATYYSERGTMLEAVAQALIDNLQLGQGNYIANGAFFKDTTGWGLSVNSSVGQTGALTLYAHSTQGNVLRVTKSNSVGWWFFGTGMKTNGGNIMLPNGKFSNNLTYTVAFWVYSSNAHTLGVGIMNGDATNVVATLKYFTIPSNKWVRVSYTFKANSLSNNSTRLYITTSDTFVYSYYTKFVLVEGTKAPEWSESSQYLEAQMKANADVVKAITDNYTQISGGLILSTFLKLGALLASGEYKESAGFKAMLENSNEIAAYFGGTYAEALANIKEAMTIIYHNGKFKSKDAEITGVINATSGTFKDVLIQGSMRNKFSLVSGSFDTKYNDNIAMYSSSEGWTTAFSLPWDAEQIGRRLLIANFYWNGSISRGEIGIDAPSGKYFYIDGVRKSKLVLNRQVVELVGYGTGNTFYGWIVLNCIDVYTDRMYGSTFKVLATGTVTGTSSSASMQCMTVDGSKLTVSRVSQGRYKVSFPSSWFSSSGDYMVWLQGTGWSYGENTAKSTAYIKATLLDKQSSYFEVGLSDDATSNDGSFMFMINNTQEWNNWG